jgi:hypothetical protein
MDRPLIVSLNSYFLSPGEVEMSEVSFFPGCGAASPRLVPEILRRRCGLTCNGWNVKCIYSLDTTFEDETTAYWNVGNLSPSDQAPHRQKTSTAQLSVGITISQVLRNWQSFWLRWECAKDGVGVDGFWAIRSDSDMVVYIFIKNEAPQLYRDSTLCDKWRRSLVVDSPDIKFGHKVQYVFVR